MPKLNCTVSLRLMNEIKRIQVENNFSSRGDALEYIVDLALNNMNHPIDDFGNDDYKDCSLKLSEAKYETTKSYRKQFLLTKKTHFLEHALGHGVTIHNAQTTIPVPNISATNEAPGNSTPPTP